MEKSNREGRGGEEEEEGEEGEEKGGKEKIRTNTQSRDKERLNYLQNRIQCLKKHVTVGSLYLGLLHVVVLPS